MTTNVRTTPLAPGGAEVLRKAADDLLNHRMSTEDFRKVLAKLDDPLFGHEISKYLEPETAEIWSAKSDHRKMLAVDSAKLEPTTEATKVFLKDISEGMSREDNAALKRLAAEFEKLYSTEK